MDEKRWLRRFRRSERRSGPSIGDEWESFLQGRSLQQFRDEGRPPPAWAYVNRLARGSHGELLALAAERVDGERRDAASWDGVLVWLARMLLADVRDPADLHSRQIQALWPLEDELIEAARRIDMAPHEVFIVARRCLIEATEAERGRP